MKLNPHEIQSTLWQKLVAHYTPVLAKHRVRLENPKIAESERIQLCWQIQAIKDLFELAEPSRKNGTDAG